MTLEVCFEKDLFENNSTLSETVTVRNDVLWARRRCVILSDIFCLRFVTIRSQVAVRVKVVAIAAAVDALYSSVGVRLEWKGFICLSDPHDVSDGFD